MSDGLNIYDQLCRHRFEHLEENQIGILQALEQIKQKIFNGMSQDISEIRDAIKCIKEEKKEVETDKKHLRRSVWKALIFGIGGSIVVGVLVHLILNHLL